MQNRQSARARDVARKATPGRVGMPPYTNTEAGLRPLGQTPRPSPCTRRVWVPRTVPRAACTLATPRRPHAVIGRRPHARRRPIRCTLAMPRPIPVLASTWCPSHRLNRLELNYKAGQSSPRACTEPPPSAIGALTVNSTPACFCSQTRAAPHSTMTPCSSCACLLNCLSRRLTGASVLAAAAGRPSPSSAPRAIPEPTNRISTSPRSQWSCPCHTLTSSAPVLARIWVPAAAPPPVRRRRLPATPTVNPPPPIGRGWAQLLIPLACLPVAPHLAAGELAFAAGCKGEESRVWLWRV
jgi:hypothetical protein